MTDPELFLNMHRDRLVIIDEVQTVTDLFPVLRSVIDTYRVPGRFVLLGSASGALINRSSESLAGRASFLELSPFLPTELVTDMAGLFRLLVREGFPLTLPVEEPLLKLMRIANRQ